MKSLVCIDSNAVTYLVDAIMNGGQPIGDVASEKISLLRTYLYRDDTLHISPTVKEEYEKIKNEIKRKNHQGIADILLSDVSPPDSSLVESRASEYSIHHKGVKNKKDCKILAEAELSGCNILLTYDQTLLKNLRSKTQTLKLCEPSKYWNSIGINKGAKPVRSPHDTNPLACQTWWKW